MVLGFNLRILSNYGILVARRILKKPTFLWGHIEGRSSITTRFGFMQVRLADAFITYTTGQRDRLQSSYPRLPVIAAPNACLHESDCRFLKRTAAEVTNVICVGRLTNRKKPTLLLDGFRLAIESGTIPPQCRLLFVGNGPKADILKKTVSVFGLESRVEFHGHISKVDSLRRLYSTALVSVSPGYVGLSAVQSFGFGVPMLVAREEPHSPEIAACREGFNTIFFSSNNPKALVGALGTAFAERESILAKRQAISDYTRGRFTYEKMAEDFENAIGRFCSVYSPES